MLKPLNVSKIPLIFALLITTKMKFVFTTILTLATIITMAQFNSKAVDYRYAEPVGSNVRVYKDRFSYDTITFQCKKVLNAEWSGNAVIVTILTQSGNEEIWRCTSTTERRKLR